MKNVIVFAIFYYLSSAHIHACMQRAILIWQFHPSVCQSVRHTLV